MEIQVEKFIQFITDALLKFIPNLIGAILLLVIGVFVCRFIRKIISRMMIKRAVDITVQTFVNQLIRWVLYILLLLAVIQKLGIPASSLLGALTASAVAIGLALQGSLSNFAGGIMLLILKPFKIGDVIQAKGETGTVQKISMFYTILNKFGNEQVIIPNGPLFADNIINFSAEQKRRIKILVGISYGSNLQMAKEILLRIAQENNLVLKEISPVVFVEELAESSVNISLRVWTLSENYWDTYFGILEKIKKEFDTNNIEIPFPQRDLNIRKSD